MKTCSSIIVLASLFISQVSNAQTYRLIDLGTLGGNYSSAYAINNSGQVVGTTYNGGQQNAFLYSDGLMQYLYPVSGVMNTAYGINNSGQISGNSSSRAFLYSDANNWNYIPILNNNFDRVARGLNDSGHVVGWREEQGVYSHQAFVYSSGSMQNLGTLGGYASDAYGINNSGQITGWAYTANNNQHAFLYSGGLMQDIGTLGGNYSVALSINNNGQITGNAETANGQSHAFLYSDGVMIDLGVGTLNWGSYGLGINNNGDVVGTSIPNDNSPHHAFLYSNGLMFDLNDYIDPSLNWTLEEANAINDYGQIVGYGLSPSGEHHAFLIEIVPEPSSFGLLILGVSILRYRFLKKK